MGLGEYGGDFLRTAAIGVCVLSRLSLVAYTLAVSRGGRWGEGESGGCFGMVFRDL